MEPWFKRTPDQLQVLRVELSQSFPNLRVEVCGDHVFVRGVFPVHLAGKVIDHYKIEVALGQNHPHDMPLVKETGGKLAKVADRHFNVPSETACLFVVDEQWRHYPPGTSITQFLQNPVTQFFIAQTYYDLTQKWIFGERAHNSQGTLDYYKEELQVISKLSVVRCLLTACMDKIPIDVPCPCGSGHLTRECHLKILVLLKNRIGKETLFKAYEAIKYLPCP